MNEKIKAAITLGDPAGIGPEVVARALSDSRMCELFTPVVYGPASALEPFRSEEFQFTTVASASDARPRRVNFVDCTDTNAARQALLRASEDKKKGVVDVIVTAPINKETIDFGHTGHTEFFAAQFGGQPLMMMCSELLKIGLATTHMPLAEVGKHINKELIISKLKQLRQSLRQDFAIVEPRIAVLALNPHSGDGGLLGGQEKEVIKPAIDESGVLAFGPFAADGFFAAANYKKYDAVLAMYHDQGLIPFKALTPEGVNFTAGIGVVRTSPDHGVAYDIAGPGVADPTSMREAIYLALDILRNRARWNDMNRNPLQHFEREKGHKDLSVKDLIPETNE
jgi:4-hydroxythreonine-4-phosphate dehydrogenase